MSKILGPDVSLIDILDDKLLENQAKDEENLKKGISKYYPLRPSSSGSCERELAFKLMEHSGQAYYEKEGMDPNTIRLLGLGASVEYSIISFLKQVDVWQVKYQQQSLAFFNIESTNDKIKYFIEGSIDLCLIFNNGKHKMMLDVKSKKDKFSSTHKSQWDEANDKYSNLKTLVKIGEGSFYADDLEAFLEELNDPFFEANFLQLNLYLNSSFAKERGIDIGAILQYNKNTSGLREIRFRPSEKLYKKVEEKFKSAAAAATAGDPMKANTTYLPGSIKCSFCSYAKVCRPNTDVKKAFFETLPTKYFPTNIAKIQDETLKQLIKEYDAVYDLEKSKKALEERLAKRLLDSKIYKVKLESGTVYEVKTFKTTTSVKKGKV